MTSEQRTAVKRFMQQLIIDGVVSPTEWPVLQSKWLKDWEIWVSHMSCRFETQYRFIMLGINLWFAERW